MMKTKNHIVIWSGLSLLIFALSGAANDEFKQWMQQQSEGVGVQKVEFQEYKDKRDKEFTSFLKAQWKAVDVVAGEVLDEAPKPDVMPVAPPETLPVTPPMPAAELPMQEKPVQIVVIVPEAAPSPAIIPRPVIVTKGEPLNINFYGKQLRFFYDRNLKKKLNVRIDKNAVSDYWSALSRTDYDGLMTQLKEQKNYLQLNDWAYASLINKVAAKINASRKNETALLSWFLLAKSGYRARIAYNDTSIYLLVPSQQEMFEVSYFTFGGKRFYAVTFEGKKPKLGRVFTYDGEYPDTTKDFDMRVTPVVASAGQVERRHLAFEFEGKKYTIEAVYDRGRIQFFRTYPQLNLNLYFSSGVDRVTATPLQQQLADYMQGMSEKQAVNFLLRFVQTSLQYETDEQQFGEENYLFPEETLFYPYSDCEDRAVLFAWLVSSLLKLDVVGLDYPGHVATAVRFNEAVKGDSVRYEGSSYVVADPTYINARAGMSMPKLKQYKPTVIVY